jgi:hypothetical protein
MSEREIWLPIKEAKTEYAISNMGRFKSLDRRIVRSDGQYRKYKSVIIAYHPDKDDYFTYTIHLSNNPIYVKIHRLVATAFIPNPLNKPEVNHKNGNKRDNRAKNLEWVTEEEHREHTRKFIKHSLPYTAKKVIQFSKKGEALKEWDSIGKAARALSIRHCCISRCLAGKVKTAGGFVWIKK